MGMRERERGSGRRKEKKKEKTHTLFFFRPTKNNKISLSFSLPPPPPPPKKNKSGVSLSALGRSVVAVDPTDSPQADALRLWWDEEGKDCTPTAAGEAALAAAGKSLSNSGPRPRAALASLLPSPGEPLPSSSPRPPTPRARRSCRSSTTRRGPCWAAGRRTSSPT